jgi:hypothetical protein
LPTAFAADDFIAVDFAADDFTADDFAAVGFATDGLAFATGFDFATGFLGADFAADVFDEALAMASSHCERGNGSGLHHGCRSARKRLPVRFITNHYRLLQNRAKIEILQCTS